MKAVLFLIPAIVGFSGCASKVKSTTREHRAIPSNAVAYGNYISQRTEQLQSMGGPFKDRSVAALKAQEEASSRFGDGATDSVTTTWSSSKNADRIQAQEDFTDKLDDIAKEKKAH
jgi:hypothetical protein